MKTFFNISGPELTPSSLGHKYEVAFKFRFLPHDFEIPLKNAQQTLKGVNNIYFNRGVFKTVKHDGPILLK